MPRRKTQAKTDETLPADASRTDDVGKRRTPVWHRQVLRRLAIHGNLTRAAMECNISKRQIERVMSSKPRFRKGVQAAQRIALSAHTDRMQARILDIAENGYQKPVVSGGRFVMNARTYIPNLMKMVAEVTVPMFRQAKERNAKYAGQSVSNISNTLNISLTQTQMDDPETLALMLALSDKLTQANHAPKAIDVTPPGEPDA